MANTVPRRKAEQRRTPDTRRERRSRLYDLRAWRDGLAPRWLSEQPLCVKCAEHGIVKEATQVDHIDPHNDDPVKFWDVNNLQSLCDECHALKTRHDDRG